MLDYASVRALAREAQARGMSLGQVVLEDQSREMSKTQEEMLEMSSVYYYRDKIKNY